MHVIIWGISVLGIMCPSVQKHHKVNRPSLEKDFPKKILKLFLSKNSNLFKYNKLGILNLLFSFIKDNINKLSIFLLNYIILNTNKNGGNFFKNSWLVRFSPIPSQNSLKLA